MEWGLVTSSDTAGTVYFSYGYRFGIGEVAVRGPDGKPIGFCQFEIRPVCLTSACFMTLARKEFLTNRIDTYLNMSIID